MKQWLSSLRNARSSNGTLRGHWHETGSFKGWTSHAGRVETFIAGPYFYTLPLLLATLICVVRHNWPPSSMENLRECSPSFSSPSLQLVDLNRCQIKIAHRVTYFSAEFLDISRVGRIPLKYLFFNFVFTRSPFLPKFLLMLLQMPGISIFRKIIIEKHRYLDRIELDSNLLYF